MGFKIFVNGDILDATEVNDFLMKQSVMVFADAAARTTALPAPIEGMVTYLSDTDLLEVFTGSGFVVVNDNTAAILKSTVTTKADIIVATDADTPVRFGVGTNEQRLIADSAETVGLKYVPDTTNFAVAAKGDLLAGTAADTVAALTVGTNDHVLTADSSEATGMKWAAVAAGGGGKVLQVVSATTSTGKFVASTTFTDTNLTATITPSAASSRVLVLVSQQLRVARGTIESGGAHRLVRDSTAIYDTGGTDFKQSIGIFAAGSGTTTIVLNAVVPMSFVDSPATTAATTYKTQVRVNTTANGNSIVCQDSSAVSSIVLLEIGA